MYQALLLMDTACLRQAGLVQRKIHGDKNHGIDRLSFDFSRHEPHFLYCGKCFFLKPACGLRTFYTAFTRFAFLIHHHLDYDTAFYSHPPRFGRIRGDNTLADGRTLIDFIRLIGQYAANGTGGHRA